MRLEDFPRRSLAILPTPLAPLPRFAAALGAPAGRRPRIYMKRDDQTGLATGGNKARKLEFLIGEAIAGACDCVITGGAAQSNHCRQTAAAAAACGLECVLVLGGEEPARLEGNLLLDRLLGARVVWCGPRRKGEDIPAIAEELRAAGKRPYVIPYGGSSATGALGFVAAALELKRQLEERRLSVSRIVFASSSGGTQAGLMAGARLFGLEAELRAICIDKAADEGVDFGERVLRLANETAELLELGDLPGAPGAPAFGPADVVLRREFTGGGYGVVGELERKAIGLLARSEGVLVDPVYAGRALGALISMVEAGEFGSDEAIVFWHTGGTPALFAYANEIA